jgi:transcriptional regulator with XRE-family HTH domain
MSEVDANRVKLLSDLIRDAREQAGRSPEDCARVLGIAAEEFTNLEATPAELTLPQLEALTIALNVPMDHFWGSSEPREQNPHPDFELYQSLRQRIIGVQLYQARMQAGRSAQDLAADLSLPTETITAYETGRVPIPYFEVEQLALNLGVPLAYFTEETHGPLASHETIIHMQQRFEQLPPDIKAFVVEPINLSYLQTAMRLSELDVDKLRSIAEGILDITF